MPAESRGGSPFFRSLLAQLPTVTGLFLLFSALTYFLGFERIEGEAYYWAFFAIVAGLLLLTISRLRPKVLLLTGVKLLLYRIAASLFVIILMAAQVPPIYILLRLVPDTEYVVGYLGADNPLYAWPHFVALILLAPTLLSIWWPGPPPSESGT